MTSLQRRRDRHVLGPASKTPTQCGTPLPTHPLLRQPRTSQIHNRHPHYAPPRSPLLRPPLRPLFSPPLPSLRPSPLRPVPSHCFLERQDLGRLFARTLLLLPLVLQEGVGGERVVGAAAGGRAAGATGVAAGGHCL